MPASHRALAVAALGLVMAAGPAGAQTYNVYFGDLHGHTMDSPVVLTTTSVDDYIRYARDTKSLNFVALTEKDFDLSDTEWGYCKSRAAAFTSTSFIAFSAYEWGDDSFGDFGHRPVYYSTDNQPIFRSSSSDDGHVSELLDDVVSHSNGFTSVAHPDLNNYLTDWDYFDGGCDRIAEVYSRHGHYETGSHGLQQALAQGYRFGFIAVSDTRTAQPGEYGLTAILSTSLTKSALHAALKARRCYGTSGARIVLQATMDGHAMGEEYISSTGPTLSVTCTPPGTLESIEVVKNNSVAYTWRPTMKVSPAPASAWRSGDALQAANWFAPSFEEGGLSATTLGRELQKPHKPGTPLRLRRRVVLGSGSGAIVRTRLGGEYKLWLNGALLVDTHQFQYDDPTRPHDCNAPDAHDLAGSPESFRSLGFYDVETLGGTLRQGENVLALELDPVTQAQDEPEMDLVATTTSGPVSFGWADGGFSSDSYYYLRVTQTDGQQAWSSPWWVSRLEPDTTPPQNPTKLRAHKDGNDVYLDWTKVTKDIANNVETISFYRVFRGPTPDFVPDRSGQTNQIATTTHGRYRDSGALGAAADYYYKVAAVDAAGNESQGNSNLGFKMRHPLTFHSGISNIYWLSPPYKAVYTNADELARDLNRSSSGPCTKVMRWEVGTQRPTSWVYLGGRWSGTNFSIVSGQAVAVTIKQDLEATLVGAHDEGTTVRLTVNPGAPSLNWVALPLHTPHQLADQVMQDVNNGFAPGPGTRITRLHPDLQIYQSYQWTGSSWAGTNFVLLPGEAYGIEVQSTTDWLPDTTPP